MSSPIISYCSLIVVVVCASTCGRTGMEAVARGTGDAGGALETVGGGTGGRTGGVVTAAGGGASGDAMLLGSGGAATGSADASGISSSPCGDAACLTALFQGCVPAGRCVGQGGGGPHTSVSTLCYENGVSVSWTNGWDGVDSVRGNLTVRRDGGDCYQIVWRSNATTSYVVTGAGAREVATGVGQSDGATVVVTCAGGNPTTVSAACLSPLTNNLDDCDLGTCPR